VVLVLAIYNALAIPFDQAFAPAFMSSLLFRTFDSIVDFVFVADIVLGFFTSVTSRKGTESFDSTEIYENYTSHKTFYADVLSVFGMGIFANISDIFRGFGFFKLLRVFRLNGMIAKANIDEGTKALANLLKLILYLLLYLHIVGCYMWIATGYNAPMQYYRISQEPSGCKYIALDGTAFEDPVTKEPLFQDSECTLDSKWVAGPTFAADLDWRRYTLEEDGANWQEDNARWEGRAKEWWLPLNWANFGDQRTFSAEYDLFFRYTTMFYEALLDLGSNEFGPVNEVEMLYYVVTLMASSLLNALIFGDIASLLAIISRRSQIYQDRLDSANTVMANIKLDDWTQDEIREFFQKTLTTRGEQEDFDKFLLLIAPSLRLKVQNHIFKERFKKNKVIQFTIK